MFMENKRETRGSKFKSDDGAVTPINLMNVAASRRSRSYFDPYASDSSDSPSPLMNFLANSGASSPAFVTPVKVEEDVIVMDGISVPESNKGSCEVRMRSPLMSSNSANCNFGKSNSTVSPPPPPPSSSGSGGRRCVAENSKSFKNRLCHFWETSGICHFGSECQFAHGKEELRYHRSSGKINLEISKSNSSFAGSSPSPSPYGPKFSRNSQIKAASTTAEEETFSSRSLPLNMGSPASPLPAQKLSDWTPRVDGIEVNLPSGSSPSKEDVDAYIENVLYGTEVKKRLLVFVEICPHS